VKTAVKAPAKPLDPTGRVDVLVYNLVDRYLLPELEKRTGISGLAGLLRPHAEAIIADNFPAKSILPAPKPRRRLS